MKNIFYTLFFGLMLLGCVATASTVKNIPVTPAAEIIDIDINYDKEMLDLARDMEEERVKAIYVVVISEPEIITARPPKK